MPPDLIVPSGSVLELPARTHHYTNIEIQTGGVLRIAEESIAWCILYAEANFVLNGQIIFERFSHTNNPINAIAPDGVALTFQFNAVNIGGYGGDGGQSLSTGQVGLAGRGAGGTIDFGGGGGGGGGFAEAGRTGRVYPGSDAVQHRGGPQVSQFDGKGGNGARRARYGNGGLLYISVLGTFQGAGGAISLKGLNGTVGGDGGPRGFEPTGESYFAGGGGGGGGAPGGCGGFCRIKVGGSVTDYPDVDVRGGDGGPGGQGGRKNGLAGEPGEDGPQGLVDFVVP